VRRHSKSLEDRNIFAAIIRNPNMRAAQRRAGRQRRTRSCAERDRTGHVVCDRLAGAGSCQLENIARAVAAGRDLVASNVGEDPDVASAQGSRRAL